MSIQHIATFVLELALALFTAYVAYAQATRMPAIVKAREHLHFPQWYWNLATVLAVIGALGLLVGLFIPVVAAVAVLWMAVYFVVAALTHMSTGDFKGAVPGIFCLAITAGLMALRWGDFATILAFVGVK
jgi:uncharacterized membrane protein YphA (DoxX/SURF4 family)